MFFEVFGFLLSSLIGAVAIIYKISGDIAPAGLVRFLHRNALKNWQKSQPKRLGFYNTGNPKCTADTGILPSQEEDALELPRNLQHTNETDEITFYGVDDNGNGLLVRMTRFYGNITDAHLQLYLNGVSYSVSRRGRNSSLTDFVLGNFKLELVESMRCWRIWYNGVLWDENNGNSVHAVLNFLWKPFDSPLDTKRDLNLHLLSDFCTKSGTFGTSLVDLSKVLPDGYIQFGAHHGTIRIDDGNEERLYLYGFRNRKWDSLPLQPTFLTGKFPHQRAQLELFGMSGCDGNAFRLVGTTGGWIDGHTLFPSNKKFPVTHVDVEPSLFLHNGRLPKLFTVTDQNRSFHIEIWPRISSKKFLDMEIVLLKLTVNGKSGRGILLRTFDHSFPSSRFNSIIDTSIISSLEIMEKAPYPLFNKSRKPLTTPEIVAFHSEHGRDVALVGGKGASLAHLAKVSDDSGNFWTAKGFCVTTTSFRQRLPLDEFRVMFANAGSKEDLVKTCSAVMNRIKSSDAKEAIRPILQSWLHDVFRGSVEVRLAVRSSGTLEDGTELSCAGQNQTFLGILPQDVAEKVVECWASLFTFQSVQYRLNHGQPAVSEMAVVVQEMVHARAAGVLFTADPRTGNPFKMMISANYGLGESVVSAACDPDTITLTRSSNSEPRIAEMRLGTKKSKIVLNEEGSTAEVDIDDVDSGSYCISNSIATALGKVAVKIEEELGDLKPVDIEWAVNEEGEIFILQCRSITSLDSWTDFELIHEADSSYNTSSERLTHANTGEVMPGVTSPLSLSIVVKLLDVGIQLRANHRNGDRNPIVPYALRKCAISRQRLLLNVLNVLYVSLDKEITTDKVASDLSVFGHRVMDEELHAIALERHGLTSPLQKIRELCFVIMTIWQTKTEIIRATKRFENYTIPLDTMGGDARKLYSMLTERMLDLYEVSNAHCMMSEASTVTQMFGLLSLAQGRKADEWDSDIYEDVSKVLSVCMDVESADLPTAMDELAKTVAQHGGGSPDDILRDFVEKNPGDGFHWLSHHEQPIIRESLENFFEKHGHRCISELDLMRKSWKSDPIPFVNLLQSLVRNKIKFDSSKTNGPRINQFKNDEALLSSLHTPFGFISKCFMKFLLPYCRRAVWNREKTKSYMVRTGDQLKQGYELLAQLMVKDQLLPDSKLIYFITHQQIRQLLDRHHSSPKILYKAMRKMKLFPELNKEEYPEITIGIREPVERTENVEYGDSIIATPVSSGKVQAKGKVCMSIEEASRLIEPGDILITHGTDIGWSPFFPILGGIVTELGGLISHGAVVAREYGLPCIVGAGNATKIFKTGELLLLDAGKGTLTKVKVNS